MCTSGCSGESEIPLKADGSGPATVARANEVIRTANPGVDNPPQIRTATDGQSARFPLADNQKIEGPLRATGDKELVALADLIAAEHAKALVNKKEITLAGNAPRPDLYSNLLFTGQPAKSPTILSI